MVIDLWGLSEDDVRHRFPEVYQHVKLEVKQKVIVEDGEQKKVGRDWNNRQSYRDLWWVFGEPREELRPALASLKRYIATPVTQKHRTFEWLSGDILPDDALMVVASADAFCLGVLHSKAFAIGFGANASTLEDRPRFIKSRCFDPFPFPAANEMQKGRIRSVAEELDAHRKHVLAAHSYLTLTALYNVLSKVRAGSTPDTLDVDEHRVFNNGLLLILNDLHEKLDRAVAAAYGWLVDFSEEEVLAKLIALNKERAKEEASGVVQWLRPEYQIPRLGSPKERAELDLVGVAAGQEIEAPAAVKPSFPADDIAQTAAVMAALAAASGPQDAVSIASNFRQGRRNLRKVDAILTALARMGFVGTTDGGRSFTLRRAA
jgi:hypothetical protein